MRLAPPVTLTPSKLGRFASCPLAFRFAYVDGLEEPPTPAQVRGTLVHRSLQRFFGDVPAPARSPARLAAALAAASEEPEARGALDELGLDATARARLLREAGELLERYLELEDPTTVHPIGLELDLRVEVDGVVLRGIIDRLDLAADGGLVVVDYKTGRAPRPERSRSRLLGVLFYAYLCEQLLGRRPSEIRLLYLADQVVVAETPTAQSMRGLRQRALAAWAAIERACEAGDFRPRPSPLCRYCAFQERCPAQAAVSAGAGVEPRPLGAGR
ncbi:MAG TPA: PD-(D/E)XK nuclease family protein [Acidimicrobiales bacterium]|nr:PD-(D/E)XK nuclease family protein [Acidimicrobiales bacterium]